ncbi:adenosine deaminase [Lutimonas halocynthiae]|uniref:adenosine deaminase n=1 Tax=Lutimonas halocynthiae TaxID=1446477 RepID=UPI0025B2CF7E|nr:adenosine deaminase [Lutimonas halocynthiae]MDN3643283.1 adenosine deaminase [Lutimonas halocynthiae]
MDYKKLPKVELHLHLDCSLSFDVVSQIDPSVSFKDYSASFIAPAKCKDLADYLHRANRGVDLMQTKAQLRLVTLDLFKQLKDDHVIYAEIRFAPLLHTMKGLSSAEVVESVNRATEEGIRKYGIDANLILCTLRHYSKEQSLETVRLVEAYKNTNVVGFDIAANEAGFPIDNHIEAFKYAHDKHIPCTSHAGEAKGAESVWETLLNFYPSRIGHGVRSVEDEKLLAHLKANKIHLEVCPTSNIQTDVFENIEHHSANKLFEYGVSMSLNTDSRTISNVTLADEYALMEKTFDWKKKRIKHCIMEAIKHSFASDAIKDTLRNTIEAAYH